MAKGARASTRKRNNAALRAKIFGPATDARTERLSTKLKELISKPKPAQDKVMADYNMGEEVKEKGSRVDHANLVDDMDVDPQTTIPKRKHKHYTSKVEKKKAHRKTHKKAKNSIVFPARTQKRGGPGVLRTKR